MSPLCATRLNIEHPSTRPDKERINEVFSCVLKKAMGWISDKGWQSAFTQWGIEASSEASIGMNGIDGGGRWAAGGGECNSKCGI